MRIEVAVEEWQQACCGDPFRIGDRVTWTVSAADPAGRAPDALTRFNEDHHDLIAEEVPSAEVTGEVTEITGVAYAREEVGAVATFHRLDVTRPTAFALTSVERGSERPLDTYLVRLDVADDVELPAYLLSEAEADRRRQDALTSDLNRARRGDGVGQMLDALARDTRRDYAAVADITQPADRGGCRVVPHRDGATAIRWARSDVADQDGIAVTTGDGSWFLPASRDGVAQLRAFVAAAAEGRVRESVRRGDGTLYLLDTEVHAADRTWTSTTEYEGPDPGQGVFMVVKRMWDRVQRGDHTYAAWGAGPARH